MAQKRVTLGHETIVEINRINAPEPDSQVDQDGDYEGDITLSIYPKTNAFMSTEINLQWVSSHDLRRLGLAFIELAAE